MMMSMVIDYNRYHHCLTFPFDDVYIVNKLATDSHSVHPHYCIFTEEEISPYLEQPPLPP